MATDTCDDPTYTNTIAMQKRFRLLNVPPSRLNNITNPYTNNYTQEQLNMRRKAEILKYNASKSNTKSNNLTKRQKWGQLVAGSTQRRSLPNSYIQNNLVPGTTNTINSCPTVSIPTYASDVPGAIMNLYEDPTVPLYMYSKNTDSYGIINQEQNTEFTYDNEITNLNRFINKTENVLLTSIYIMKILTQTYIFTIQFPISIFISGNISSIETNTYNESITVSFLNQPFQSYIYYGSQEVSITNQPSIGAPSSTSVTFDISMNINPDSSNNYFYGIQYIGMYSLYDVTLNTEEGYIYDLYLNNTDLSGNSCMKINIPENNDVDFINIKYGICANVSRNFTNNFIKCSVQNPDSYPSFYINDRFSIV